MARPSKYNWTDIQLAYEGGLDVELIAKKFGLTPKNLKDKARLEKWVINSSIKADVDEFLAKSEKLAINYEKHPEISEIIVDKINTQIQDNELIENNRKLAKMLQGVIVSNRSGINLKNIKNVSGVLTDIEKLANPTISNTAIQVNNLDDKKENSKIEILLEE